MEENFMNDETTMVTSDEIEETELMESDNESERSGNGLGKIVLGVGVVAAGALAAWAYKNRAKLEERKIERLRKKGYVIYKDEAAKDIVDDFDDEELEDDK